MVAALALAQGETARLSLARRLLVAHTMNHCEAELHPDCTGIAVHRHHRKLRRHGDPETLWVCAFCHTQIHASPAEAYRRGLLVRSWETTSDVPVRVDL